MGMVSNHPPHFSPQAPPSSSHISFADVKMKRVPQFGKSAGISGGGALWLARDSDDVLCVDVHCRSSCIFIMISARFPFVMLAEKSQGEDLRAQVSGISRTKAVLPHDSLPPAKIISTLLAQPLVVRTTLLRFSIVPLPDTPW